MRYFVCLIVFFSSLSLVAQKIVEKDFSAHFNKYNVAGSFVLYDIETATYYTNSKEKARLRSIPASTFKVPNSLIALELGIVTDTSSFMKWDGTIRNNAAWNQNMSFIQAFRVSCVPCYQEIARQVGVKKYNSYVKKLGFGNMIVTPNTLTTFWLGGQSGISPMEQVRFLSRLYQNNLPVSERSMAIVKQLMLRERTADMVLSGKTGWATKGELNLAWADGMNVGWFVGWIEYKNKPYIFATNVQAIHPDENQFIASRIGITKLILTDLGLY